MSSAGWARRGLRRGAGQCGSWSEGYLARAGNRRSVSRLVLADRLHPERRPGLSDDRCAAAGWSSPRADDGGARWRHQDRPRYARCRQGHRDFRAVGARQFRRPRQCRRQLRRAQALGSAEQGKRNEHSLDRRAPAGHSQRGSRRQAIRRAAAADPGRRQCWRPADATPIARWQLQLSEAERGHPAAC